jgi:hypothetical protein
MRRTINDNIISIGLFYNIMKNQRILIKVINKKSLRINEFNYEHFIHTVHN